MMWPEIAVFEYRRWDSNPHALNGHRILNPARLPIPPLRRYQERVLDTIRAGGDCQSLPIRPPLCQPGASMAQALVGEISPKRADAPPRPHSWKGLIMPYQPISALPPAPHRRRR